MDEVINLLKEIKIKLSKIEDFIVKNTNPTNTDSIIERQTPHAEFLTEFDLLKDLLNSDDWPCAVHEFQMVDQNSEEEKMDRAKGIIDILIQEDLSGKKFLDFGCGEGHMAKYAAEHALISIGYDIIKSAKSKLNWETREDNFLLTTDYQKVIEEGPYDVIMIYDVIDHATQANPEDILTKAKLALKDNGKIYLRTHPWCSRHGSHLYQKINKAFVHLIFTENELEQLGYQIEEKNIKILYPMDDYKNIIEKSMLKSKNINIDKNDVEDFFKNNKIIKKRLKKLTKEKEFSEHQMRQCFHDYILNK